MLMNLLFLVLFAIINHDGLGIGIDNDELREISKSTLSKVSTCINKAWMMKDREAVNYTLPYDAEEHYQELKSHTEQFRTIGVHEVRR